MNIPQTTFDCSIDSEARRLLFVASNISTGFYKAKNIPVLPQKRELGVLSIYFPKLEYDLINNFWERVKLTQDDMTFEDNPELVNEVIGKLGASFVCEKNIVQKVSEDWKEIEEKFWHTLSVLFPSKVIDIKSINIKVTEFGSRASYKKIGSSSQKELLCYIRSDKDVSHIAWGIVSSLISENYGNILYSWEEIMSSVDILMTQTSLADLFPNYRPGLALIKNASPKLLEESQKYLTELGMNFEKSFKQEEGEIFLKNKSLTSELTRTQIKILTLLMNLEGKIVSVYEIGDEIWKDSEDFSLWAVNKTMQRLRSKLIELGASPLCIKVLRGRGYVFNNTL